MAAFRIWLLLSQPKLLLFLGLFALVAIAGVFVGPLEQPNLGIPVMGIPFARNGEMFQKIY